MNKIYSCILYFEFYMNFILYMNFTFWTSLNNTFYNDVPVTVPVQYFDNKEYWDTYNEDPELEER